MNSLVKMTTSQSHQATRRWLASQSFFYSTITSRLTKSAKPSDSKPPEAPPPPPQDWLKPSTIPYQSKVANSVALSGYIHKPVQFKAAPDGKFWADTVISQNPSSNAPPLCIRIIFEGDLAHVAAFHLKENDHVYIDGQLSADPPSSGATQNQANVQVMVRSINFVDESPPKKKSNAPPKEEMTLTYSARTKGGTEIAADAWRDLLDNPKEWRDYRQLKLNGLVKPNYPDFKCKDGVRALWLVSAPKWVVPSLEGVEFDIPSYKSIPIKKSRDEPWKDLVENPSMWWDNRLDKINGKVKEKFPDFKHRENGTALWVSDLPTWAESKLPPLKSKKWDRKP
ncbi:plastid transcriptionally active 9, ORGANELLAR SINGLE-STRANDED DNA BINDING PROTEIN 2 [Hibiscus trionum]|uniref:Plastid transcriptionally active 9, ORGANELLAR SINGLE-STRANDED DNA BINDING PROTEIN 2 n=1 Tax=Hibiscus trionum TaxID=183268 RepID=A0A9W7J532_HIBTR|nr:plastid transcriptionally active 9, ORGANELLAR SINGLE-STRANDED DNA BINDING PROTEIN 2 [Hibiscus trionum]